MLITLTPSRVVLIFLAGLIVGMSLPGVFTGRVCGPPPMPTSPPMMPWAAPK